MQQSNERIITTDYLAGIREKLETVRERHYIQTDDIELLDAAIAELEAIEKGAVVVVKGFSLGEK